MTDTPLIRRQVTADRANILVSTSDVLECIHGLGISTFTTRDIAEALASTRRGVDAYRLEYSVRTAVTWLCRRGYIHPTDETVKRYTAFKDKYSATVYAMTERGEPCDVCLLNRIFLRVTV